MKIFVYYISNIFLINKIIRTIIILQRLTQRTKHICYIKVNTIISIIHTLRGYKKSFVLLNNNILFFTIILENEVHTFFHMFFLENNQTCDLHMFLLSWGQPWLIILSSKDYSFMTSRNIYNGKKIYNIFYSYFIKPAYVIISIIYIKNYIIKDK